MNSPVSGDPSTRHQRELRAQLFEAWMNRYHFHVWAGTSEEQRASVILCVALFMEGFK